MRGYGRRWLGEVMAVDLHPSPLRYAPDVGRRSLSVRQTVASLDATPSGAGISFVENRE